MITKVEIENYKSIRKLTLELGRMNVFIGENGCGKTNILEAIALGSAASRNKLDNEYLVPRGIRVTRPELMRSAFITNTAPVVVRVDRTPGKSAGFHIVLDEYAALRLVEVGESYEGAPTFVVPEDVEAEVRTAFTGSEGQEVTIPPGTALSLFLAGIANASVGRSSASQQALDPHPAPYEFSVFCPENSMLRGATSERLLGALGVKGEGMLETLQDLAAQPDAPAIAEINEHLALLDWFERFEVPSRDMAGRALRIRDRYLAEGVVFDQKSANEGFLFLLFYLTLFISPHTPRFFAIDNVDASLNPKLCQALMASMVTLAKQHDKQAIVTTHNPSLLDGLDLHDDDQRLFVVSRGLDGETRIRRVSPPKPLAGDDAVRLSEAFINGFIGGLAKNF